MNFSITIFYHKITGQSWLGGSHYFENLNKVVSDFFPELFFSGINLSFIPKIYPNRFGRIKIQLINKFNRYLFTNFRIDNNYSYLKKNQRGKNSCIYAVAVEHLLNVEGFPRIFWIPDFQVFHLSHFFEKNDINYRKKSYNEGCRIADMVVLSSKAAQNDLKQFYPNYLFKSRVLNFVVDIPSDIFLANPDYLISKYNLPKKFFFVPNQFWKHKNHMLIFSALKKMVESIKDVHVVFSGSKEDLRNPDYYSEIIDFIEKSGISENISLLGIIPKKDVLQLIRQSCAVINASKFEGWSTTVEEVKSIGKRILLSDIEVHREQNPPYAYYFSCDDHCALSDLMKKVWCSSQPGPDYAMEQQAKENLFSRKKRFALEFKSIIEDTILLFKKK